MSSGITIKETHSEGLKKVYDVFLPSVIVDDLLDDTLKKKAAETSVAGFRKGKVSIEVVKKMLDLDLVLEQVVIDKAFASLVEYLPEKNKEISSNPKIINLDLKGFKENKDEAKCSLEIEFMPEVPLIEVDDIEINSYNVEVSDDDIETTIQELMQTSHRYCKEESVDYEVKDEDIVHIDFIGKIGNKSFNGGSGKDFKVLVGGKKLVPEMEDGLLGMHLNEEKVIDVNFESSYHDKELAGKNAKFSVKLNSIERKMPIKSLEDLIQSLKCENDTQLKEKIKENILISAKKVNRDIMAQDFSSKVNARYVFDVPQSMVEREKNTITQYYEQNPEQSSEMGHKLSLAEFRVKFGMMFARFAKENSISVTKEETMERIMSMVYGNVSYASYMIDLFKQNPVMLQNINADILEIKVLDFLLSKVKSIEKTVSFKELLQIARGLA